jgi:hypothetical protein
MNSARAVAVVVCFFHYRFGQMALRQLHQRLRRGAGSDSARASQLLPTDQANAGDPSLIDEDLFHGLVGGNTSTLFPDELHDRPNQRAVTVLWTPRGAPTFDRDIGILRASPSAQLYPEYKIDARSTW